MWQTRRGGDGGGGRFDTGAGCAKEQKRDRERGKEIINLTASVMIPIEAVFENIIKR